MKHTSRSHGLLALLLLFLLVIILSLHTARASRLLQQPEPDVTSVDDIPQPGHATEMEEKYIWELMGLHECEEEDEECLKRRMISEAHLDYIYTQRHKPYKKGSTSP